MSHVIFKVKFNKTGIYFQVMSDLPTDKIINCFYGSSEDCVKVIDPESQLLSSNPNGLKGMEIDDASDAIGKNWLSFWEGNM
jgi:hypothetical protein